ncbi:MAG TPA: UDP-N-acetylmuramate--L-alanine ligase, partial [Chitinophagaceae bacterium]|nr:UDP-N-acetylmuramate--L-alanine ligase [Chitinophagaceae bacterium]
MNLNRITPFRGPGGKVPRIIHFIGIGGIGMSALARFFHSKGAQVSGYDKTETSLTKELIQEGMKVHYDDNPGLVPDKVELVVYTPAIPNDHKEWAYCREKGYKLMKRSEVLQWITESSFNICIAGTHGKTTITTMIAHILRDSGFGCNAFLGGISVNYNTNFWPQAPAGGNEKNVCVVEADEYDRSFLKLSPDIAIITAMDADHLDIYGTASAMEEAFIEFSKRLKPGGKLIKRFGLKRGAELANGKEMMYSLQNESADTYAKNIRMQNGGYAFDVVIREKLIENITLNMGGMHNVENAVAAMATAAELDIDDQKIRDAVSSFRGVKRRFEYIIRNDRLVFIDDYAHHPEELRALITGARSLFRDRKCTVIFQPHLYSRTRDLAEGFAAVLDLADETILLPIYPARELPIPGVSSEMILGRMKNENKQVVSKEDLLNWMEKSFRKNVNKELGELL